jgi:hypothetical protein
MIGAGLPDAVATSNAQAFELISEGDAAWITDDVHLITGRTPRRLHDFIAERTQNFAA